MKTSLTKSLDLYYYNPHKPLVKGRLGRLLRSRKRIDNFGDLLGPLMVPAILERRGLKLPAPGRPGRAKRTLLTVGSILHFARDGDVVWGSGRNGRMPDRMHRFRHLDVRMTRGPLTRDFLMQRGIDVPATVYGDPGLLLPYLFPHVAAMTREARHDVTFVPHMHDCVPLEHAHLTIDPRRPFWEVVERIARSRLVVSSSLHGIIIAEALGLPARCVRSREQGDFKYRDYYLGTGRGEYTVASTVEEALSLGGEAPAVFSPEAMLSTFPYELFDADI
jgi:pyruvyltransferase